MQSQCGYRKNGRMNPAQRIIDKCGGPSKVAEMVGVHVTRVHRWTYPKSRGGTDGLIPTQQQRKLLDAAIARGINLTPADFFFSPGDSAPEEAGAAA